MEIPHTPENGWMRMSIEDTRNREPKINGIMLMVGNFEIRVLSVRCCGVEVPSYLRTRAGRLCNRDNHHHHRYPHWVHFSSPPSPPEIFSLFFTVCSQL